MISECVWGDERFTKRGWEGEMREEEEKKEEGYREWLQAATSVRDFFSFSKRLSREREMEMAFFSGGGRWKRRRSSQHSCADEETTGSRGRHSL